MLLWTLQNSKEYGLLMPVYPSFLASPAGCFEGRDSNRERSRKPFCSIHFFTSSLYCSPAQGINNKINARGPAPKALFRREHIHLAARREAAVSFSARSMNRVRSTPSCGPRTVRQYR
jgi:hypothetical protein